MKRVISLILPDHNTVEIRPNPWSDVLNVDFEEEKDDDVARAYMDYLRSEGWFGYAGDQMAPTITHWHNNRPVWNGPLISFENPEIRAFLETI